MAVIDLDLPVPPDARRGPSRVVQVALVLLFAVLAAVPQGAALPRTTGWQLFGLCGLPSYAPVKDKAGQTIHRRFAVVDIATGTVISTGTCPG